MERADLGQASSEVEIEAALRTYKLCYRRVSDPAEAAAERVASGKIVGWFQGRAEFGPRALGHRSILADPRDATVRDRVNAAVKFRESWRPFAPSILEEHAGEYFRGCHQSPYMILTFRALPAAVAKAPAVVHVDGTARVHTVSRSTDPLYWTLIKKFADRTGVPLVLNTSFNLKGDAIVNTPKDAISTFYTSGLDSLILGPFCIEKSSTTAVVSERELAGAAAGTQQSA
jgi:carbamoyltransferase